MNYLLIDDLSLEGWKSLLEKAIIKESGTLDFALDYDGAMNKLKNKYDIIFLDVRLEEKDHYINNIEEYTGYKILKGIKKSFNSVNFSTPIILMTATNKIWNIEAFKEYGADSFFVKEHPDFIFNKKTSRDNFEKLQSDFLKLIKISRKRSEIWVLCNSILNQINQHPYFKDQDPRYQNIKLRITDKLKLGYSVLFKKQTELEKDLLLANNESLSFIIFWSILEEITKGYTDINETWDSTYKRKGEWKFRNKEYFIEYQAKTQDFKINYNSGGQNLISDDYKKYFDGIINLSEQINALLYAYIPTGSELEKFKSSFKRINSFRNKEDYIHSSVNSLFTKNLITETKREKTYKMNIEILKFINNILSLKV